MPGVGLHCLLLRLLPALDSPPVGVANHPSTGPPFGPIPPENCRVTNRRGARLQSGEVVAPLSLSNSALGILETQVPNPRDSSPVGADRGFYQAWSDGLPSSWSDRTWTRSLTIRCLRPRRLNPAWRIQPSFALQKGNGKWNSTAARPLMMDLYEAFGVRGERGSVGPQNIVACPYGRSRHALQVTAGSGPNRKATW